jgi:hypothetical protein
LKSHEYFFDAPFLPADLFNHASPRDLERCRRRVAVEAPHELRRHPDAARITWLAAFVYLRARSLTDDLVDLLIETIHRIGARAERKVERELLNDIKRVGGKQNLLFELADATLAQPDGVVREVVFPVVGEETLRDLVKEWKATGPTYRTTLRTVIRNSSGAARRSCDRHHPPFFPARFRRQPFAAIPAQCFKKLPHHAQKKFSPRFDAHDVSHDAPGGHLRC